jgi:hypothetical protein
VDIAQGEGAEAELDAFVERRSRKGDVDPDEQEELWQESVKRYNARRREEMRAAWCSTSSGASHASEGHPQRPDSTP